MVTEQDSWQQYLRQYQLCAAELTTAATADRLFKTAIVLTKQRLALSRASTLATLTDSAASMPVSVWQTELLLYYADFYSLTRANRQLLLVAGWCSALFAEQPNNASRALMLASAKFLTTYPTAQKVSSLLSHCYPAERKIPMWRQDLLSLLLTQADYLRRANAGELHLHLAQRLMSSNSEHELALLRPLLQQPAAELIQANQADNAENTVIQQLIQQSNYHQLSLADNRTIERKLTQHPQSAATVLAIASTLNRQHQHINSVRLAIGIIGRDNLAAALAHAELNGHLLRLRHPWQQVFCQFSVCLAHALQLLLPSTTNAITCRLLASCLVAPLWLDDAYPRSALTRNMSNHIRFCFNPQATIQNAAYLPQVSALLRLYALQHYLDAVCLWHQHLCQQHAPQETLSHAFHRAWFSSTALFCGHMRPIDALQQHSFNGHCNEDNHALLQQLTQLSQCYLPLNLSL